MNPVVVGPILQACPRAEAILAAIREANPEVQVVDRGAYWRVEVPARCVVTRAAIEAHAGEPFHLPSDLESVMPSFRGHFRVTEDEAAWEAP